METGVRALAAEINRYTGRVLGTLDTILARRAGASRQVSGNRGNSSGTVVVPAGLERRALEARPDFADKEG
jgi:hypothetical protein